MEEKIERKNLKIFLLTISSAFFLFLPQASRAAPKLLNTIGSVDHYTYSSSCPGTGTQNLILNTTQSSYSNVYFFFHGQNSPSPKGFCGGSFKLCTRAQEQPSSLFVGISMKGSGNEWVSKVDFPCLYNEAKAQFDALGVAMPSNTNLAAFSYGGRALQNIFNQGKQQGSVKNTLFFDACFGSWCSDVAKKSSSVRGSMSMYASSATSNDNGKKNQTAAMQAIKASSDATRYVHVPVNNHGLIPNICFWDHVNNDLCQGKGVLKSSSDPAETPATPPVQNPAGKGNFGKECDTDADCPVGNECEQSIHPNGKEYCVCEEATHCVEEYGGDVKDWTCSNGSNASYELNYCIKGGNPYYPIGENPAAKNVTSDLGRAFDGAALTESEIQKLLKKPAIKISIPGLKFSEINIEKLRGDGVDATYLYIPFLGEYIAAIYKFSVIFITVLATVFLILSGLQWTILGGGPGKEEIKKRVAGSIIGLLLSLGSYTVLYLVNPNLVEFKALRVQFIAPEPYADYEELSETADFGYAQGSGPVSSEAQKTIGGLIGGPNTLPACSKESAQNASQKLHDLKICVGPCHCGYTATRFLSYIGCGNKTLGGNANLNVTHLEQQGWVSAKITKDNYDKLPVGLLWFPGHNGVSIGDGKLFESTLGKAFRRVAEGSSCPVENTDVPAGSGICDACSKLSGHGPASKLYFRPRDPKACHSNQGWSQGTHVKEFRLVVFPAGSMPGSDKPPLGCCKITGGKAAYFGSELFCKEFSTRWDKKSRSFVNLAYSWDKNITDKSLCK